MSINFKIFAENEVIYCGSFSELPKEDRKNIVEALDEWGEILSKGGLNEMIFSLLARYSQKQYECLQCETVVNNGSTCPDCGEMLSQKNVHPQNEKISLLLNCIGMITHLEVERP